MAGHRLTPAEVERRRYAEQQDALRWERKQAAAEAADAARESRELAKTLTGIRDRGEKTAGAELLRIKREADQVFDTAVRAVQAREKEVLGAPRTVRTGATRGLDRALPVFHFQTSMASAGLSPKLGGNAAGDGPLVYLLAGGGIPASTIATNVLISKRPEVKNSTPHAKWHRQVLVPALEEAKKRYPVLAKLRADDWWAQVCEAAGLHDVTARVDQHSGTDQTIQQKVTLHSIPALTGVRIGPDGLSLTYRHRVGDSAERWNRALPSLRAAFKAAGVNAANLSASETSSGDISLRFNDRDPLSETQPESGRFDVARSRSLLGITERGEEAWISWGGSSGMVVGGVPGSGKTASMLPVFAGMVGQAELHVFDGKAGYDLHPLRNIAKTYDRSGDDAAPLECLERLEQLRVDRAAAMHTALGANNFWNIAPDTRRKHDLFPVFLILDEVQTWLDTSGKDSDEKKVSGQIIKLVRTLIQKGRSAGIVAVLTTQKPDAQSIPTVIRDNAALKICFRVSTPEQAITVLGRQSPNAPDPTSIPMACKGRAVMETEGRGIVLLQAGYRSPEQLEQELSGKKPVPDQAEVAARMLGRRVETTVTEPPREDPNPPTSEPKSETPAPPPPTAKTPAPEPKPPPPTQTDETSAAGADPVRDWAIRNGLIPGDHAGADTPTSLTTDTEEDEW